ncbi:MAG: hypothetical protein V5A43_02945 [Haloarculaceae archaeon]
MILELRAFVSAAVVGVVSLLLVFLDWQLVFPAFALIYLGYKYVYYTRRIDQEKPYANLSTLPGRLLEKTALLFVGLYLLSRFLVMPTVGTIWSVNALRVPTLDLTNFQVLLDQLLPLASAWLTVLIPLGVVSYTVGQFRERLLGGVNSEAAAARAALWESLARVPVYLAWAALFVLGPVYEFWIAIPEAFADPTTIPSATSLAPILGPGLHEAVMIAGHVVPALVIGGYYAVSREKYDRIPSVPEVIGYRGFAPPVRRATTANVAVPTAGYLAYAAAVVFFIPLGSLVRPALILPPVVALALAADVRGLTSQLKRELPYWVPGSGGDAVVFGFTAGVATLVLLIIADLGLGGLGADPAAVLYFPAIAVPLSFGANEGFARMKTRNVDSLKARVHSDPRTLQEGEVDRLLAYADARNDDLRAAAIDGLATAVWASPYREPEIVRLFQTAIQDEAKFARPGLRGFVMVFRADRGRESVGRLFDGFYIQRVVTAMDSRDVETRALAAEVFSRMVYTGYRIGRLDDLLTHREEVPLERIETEVTGSGANQNLTDAATDAFAVLWYERDGLARTQLGPDDERTLLVDTIWWADFASDLPTQRAAMALGSGPAPIDEAGLDQIRDSLDSEEPLVRFMAAHVLRSSVASLVEAVDEDTLLALLDDEDDLVRWAGADALKASIRETGARGDLLSSLLAQLAASDPARATSAEATMLATFELVDQEAIEDLEGVAETVADYVASENAAVAEPAARLLATFLEANPERGHVDPVRSSLEDGLTHQNVDVREHCLRAIAGVVEDDVGAGRPFVRGCVLNLGTSGAVSEIAASVLTRVLDEYPEYGTEVLPEMVGGLRNPTSISRQHAGAMIVGQTVSEVTTKILAEVTAYDTSGGDTLVGPLVDLAGGSGSVVQEAVFRALANLAGDFPAEARDALPPAQSALDAGDVRVRRSAGQVLSNVAIDYPGDVAPLISSLIIAVDDSDPQMRSIALVTLGTVGAEAPDAIEDDIRRVIGRLDDDSSLVREHAAKAIITIAMKHPDIVEPAAEASDRLRRLQRDPAVELDEEMVQEAANAVRTGTPPGATEEDEDGTDVFTPESADEAGQSGDTRFFEPPDADDEESDPEAETSAPDQGDGAEGETTETGEPDTGGDA